MDSIIVITKGKRISIIYNGMTFRSLKDFADEYGISISTISHTRRSKKLSYEDTIELLLDNDRKRNDDRSFAIDKQYSIRAARELRYPQEVIDAIVSASDARTITRIMETARHRY